MAYIVSVGEISRPIWDPADPRYLSLWTKYPPVYQRGDLILVLWTWENSSCPSVSGFGWDPGVLQYDPDPDPRYQFGLIGARVPGAHNQIAYRSGPSGVVTNGVQFRWRIIDGWENDETLPIITRNATAGAGDAPQAPALGVAIAIRNFDPDFLGDAASGSFFSQAQETFKGNTSPEEIDATCVGDTIPSQVVAGLPPAPVPALVIVGSMLMSRNHVTDYGGGETVTSRALATWGPPPNAIGPATTPVVLHEEHAQSSSTDNTGPNWHALTGFGIWVGYTDTPSIPAETLHAKFNGDVSTGGTMLSSGMLALGAGLCIKPITVSGGAATVQGIRKAGETVSLAAPGVSIGSVSYPDAYTWQADASGITSSATFTATASGGQTASASVEVGSGPHTLHAEAGGAAVHATLAPGADLPTVRGTSAVSAPSISARPSVPTIAGTGALSAPDLSASCVLPSMHGTASLAAVEILTPETGHRVRAVSGGVPVVVNIVPGADVASMAGAAAMGAIAIGAQVPCPSLIGTGALAELRIALSLPAMAGTSALVAASLSAAPRLPSIQGTGRMRAIAVTEAGANSHNPCPWTHSRSKLGTNRPWPWRTHHRSP